MIGAPPRKEQKKKGGCGVRPRLPSASLLPEERWAFPHVAHRPLPPARQARRGAEFAQRSRTSSIRNQQSAFPSSPPWPSRRWQPPPNARTSSSSLPTTSASRTTPSSARLQAAAEDMENGGHEVPSRRRISSSLHSSPFLFRINAGLRTWASGRVSVSMAPLFVAPASDGSKIGEFWNHSSRSSPPL